MSVLQQGLVSLSSAVTNYTVTFPSAFLEVPELILTQVYNSDSPDDTHMWIEAVITGRSSTDFSFVLSEPPDSEFYVATWMAGDVSNIVASPSGTPASGGMNLMQLPIYQGTIPNNAHVPMTIPGRVVTTQLVKFQNLKSSISQSMVILANQIANATTMGKTVLTGSKPAAQTALGVSSTEVTFPAVVMANSATAFGKSILYSPDATTARGLIGAASVTSVADAIGMADAATEFGLSLTTAANAAAALVILGASANDHTHTPSSIGAAAVTHTHAAADIVAASHITGFLTASTVATALDSIKALPDHGWKNSYRTVNNTSATLSYLDMGSKLVLTGTVPITVPSGTAIGASYSGKTGLWVSTGAVVTLIAQPGVTFYSESAQSLASPYTLAEGYHEIERVADSSWVIKNAYTNTTKTILGAASTSALKAALAITPDDLVVSADVKNLLASADDDEIRDALLLASSAKRVVEVTNGTGLTTNISSPARETIYVVSAGGTMSLALASVEEMEVGQSFEIQAYDYSVFLDIPTHVIINNDLAGAVSESTYAIPVGSSRSFTLTKIVSLGAGVFDYYLHTDLTDAAQRYRAIWVDALKGDDTNGKLGRPDYPYKTLVAASSALPSAGYTVVVAAGDYPVPNDQNLQELSMGAYWVFLPGAFVTSLEGTGAVSPIFATTAAYPYIRVYGYGNFNITSPLFSATDIGATFDITADNVVVSSSAELAILGVFGGTVGQTITGRVEVRKNIYNMAGTMFFAQDGDSGVNFDLVLSPTGTALSYTMFEASSPIIARVTGGTIGVTDHVWQGTFASSSCSLTLTNQARIYNRDTSPMAELANPLSNYSSAIHNCKDVSVVLKPGDGRMAAHNSMLKSFVEVKADDTLLLNNCVSYIEGDLAGFISGDPVSSASFPISVTAMGGLSLDVAPTLDITWEGTTPTVLTNMASFASVL